MFLRSLVFSYFRGTCIGIWHVCLLHIGCLVIHLKEKPRPSILSGTCLWFSDPPCTIFEELLLLYFECWLELLSPYFCFCVTVCRGCWWPKEARKGSQPLEQELELVVNFLLWVLGAPLGSSGRAGRVVEPQSHLPNPFSPIFIPLAFVLCSG